MKAAVKYNANDQSIQINHDGQAIVLSFELLEEIFKTLSNAATGPKLDHPGGEHFPTGINAVPSDGALSIYMEFQDGSNGQFVFPAPGKSHEQVANASEAILKGFRMLFAAH